MRISQKVNSVVIRNLRHIIYVKTKILIDFHICISVPLIKTKRNRKFKIPRTVLERRTLCFTSYKNRKLKVKLWWVGACERKKSAFLLRLFCPKEIFLTFVPFQSTMYGINFQNIYAFTYQKTLFHTLLWLVFNIVESLHCTLNLLN